MGFLFIWQWLLRSLNLRQVILSWRFTSQLIGLMTLVFRNVKRLLVWAVGSEKNGVMPGIRDSSFLV